jgi:hypothetical protein
MSSHFQLEIGKSTAINDIVSFLHNALYQERAGGRKFNLRATEKTYIAADGSSSTVKILFIRSGRETLSQWFSHMWNKKKEHALAASMLRAETTTMPLFRCSLPVPVSKGPNMKAVLINAGVQYRHGPVPVSSFRELLA